MIKLIKRLYNKCIPFFFRKIVADCRFKFEIKRIRKNQNNLLDRLRTTSKINVIFLVIHESIWKYEEVYKLLSNDPKFDVKVVIIPLVRENKGDMKTFNQTLNYFTRKNYNTISSYDNDKKIWMDIKKLTQPDIVFFTNPHRLTFDQYYIDNFSEKLTCYVPYAFVVIHSLGMHYNQNIHHLLWKYFVETKYHKDFAQTYSKSEAENVYITGFPGLDRKFRSDYAPKKVWKDSSNRKAVRIIWAPHHTIPGQGAELDYSSFMEYSAFFLELLEIRNDIQIAFKPHPLLKEKLYKNVEWGKDKTDDYFAKWNQLPNGQLEEGAYIDLFTLSDAMIMDSASFIVEYLYFDKPILFTMRDEAVKERFNSFGRMVFDYLYIAKNNADVENFIEDTVIGQNDILRIERNQFVNDTILPGNGKTASENIYNELKRELC